MSFIVKNLIKNGFDVKDAFQDYLYDWNDNEDGDKDEYHGY